jgi:transposase-like protein
MKCKRYSAEFKAKVAIEALRGLKTANEIARMHKIHPNLVWLWKRQAQASLPEVFSGKGDRRVQDDEDLKRELYQRIGELEDGAGVAQKKGGVSRFRGGGR